MVFSPMDTEHEQQIIQSQVADGRAFQRNRLDVLPQGSWIERKVESLRCDGPMQLNYHPTIISNQLINLPQAVKSFLVFSRLRIKGTVSRRKQQILGSNGVPLANQNIEVAKLP